MSKEKINAHSSKHKLRCRKDLKTNSDDSSTVNQQCLINVSVDNSKNLSNDSNDSKIDDDDNNKSEKKGYCWDELNKIVK